METQRFAGVKKRETWLRKWQGNIDQRRILNKAPNLPKYTASFLTRMRKNAHGFIKSFSSPAA